MDNNIFLAQFYGKSQNYTQIPREWFSKYGVKRGLRNEDHTGVLVGLTRIADVVGYKRDAEGNKVDCDGIYLPTREELDAFCNVLQENYDLPDDFLEMNLLRLPGKNLMNKLQHSLITLYNYDEDPDNTDVYQTLRKGLNIMSKLPSIAVYAYMSKVHYYNRQSLVIHYPRKDYSTAENILSMLRLDSAFTPKEAQLLDLLLFLHADHGGGTNSTFTNVVVSSTNTDIYSSMASSIGALKGPRHGGANVRVSLMMENIMDAVGIKATDAQIKDVIERILRGQFRHQDKLIYGFGHERIAKKTLSEEKGANMCSNVDYYSGFAYHMLGIPRDLYTPLFVISRMVGWLAHNIEHKLYDNRIVRPAAKYVGDLMDYIPMEDR